MTDEQRQRVHGIIYSTEDREELAERIVRLEDECDKLRRLVAHLMFVKPADVNAILYKGELLRFEDLLAEVGMRWESEVDA